MTQIDEPGRSARHICLIPRIASRLATKTLKSQTELLVYKGLICDRTGETVNPSRQAVCLIEVSAERSSVGILWFIVEVHNTIIPHFPLYLVSEI